LGEKGDG
jgi:hypothetical protein